MLQFYYNVIEDIWNLVVVEFMHKFWMLIDADLKNVSDFS